MKIFYDYQGFLQPRGGVSRYFVEIIKRLPSEVTSLIPIVFTDNLYLPEISSSIYRLPFQFQKKKSVYRHLSRLFALSTLRRSDFDLFHATATETYFAGKLKRPLVITVHDLIDELIVRNPAEMARRAWQIEHADHIITVSQNTRKDLLDYFKVPPRKVSTIYHGTPDLSGIATVEVPYQHYILFVGARNTAYKNFRRLVLAFQLLHQQDRELKLVCVGAPFGAEEKQFIQEMGLTSVIVLVSATDEQLFSLYCNALAFIYPSLYEGFGIPLLEAFACHCPVCLSNASCFPEIAGDAGAYFDATSVADMADVISSTIYNEAVRSKLIAAGDRQARLYSWDKAAQETMAVYQHVLG